VAPVTSGNLVRRWRWTLIQGFCPKVGSGPAAPAGPRYDSLPSTAAVRTQAIDLVCSADGRTALSKHRRQSPRRRRPRRRVGTFLISTVAAAVAIASGAVYAITVTGSGQGRGDPVADAAAGILASHSAALLERERLRMILMDSDSKMLNVVSSPKLAKRVVLAPVIPGGTGTSPASPSAPSVPASVPSPGTAEAIAYRMLPAFGFNARTQYGCLYQMWMRESGWNVRAENPTSGAYGIPQALPGSKMASAGANWATSAVTQIKWGLGYIKSVYGSPCGAWAFWQAHGWY
jgi:hypothetical protein